MTANVATESRAAAHSAAPALARLREQYLANLAALYLSDSALAARVDAVPFAQLPRFEPTRDARWTARATTDDGAAILLHSRHRPAAEADAFVAAQLARPPDAPAAVASCAGSPAAGADSGETFCFFVCGLGLGYVVEALDRHVHRPTMIVAERDAALIKAALCVCDLAAALRERRLIFISAADKAAFHARMRPLSALLMLGFRVLASPDVQRRDVAFHAEARALLRDFVSFSRIQTLSLLKNARVTTKNILMNLPHYVASPGVEALAGRAAGRPAILVAAGPSLARNVGQLAALRERAVIIAVQTAYKPLLAHGVVPHFVTTLDYHEISAQFFHGIREAAGCALVAEPKATWHVLDAFPGRRHVLASSLVDQLLHDAAPRRAALRAGSTVAHLSFYLAEHLGCDPIILVGQDLSFCDGLYYPPGVQIENVWRPELGRFQTVEMKQWERIARARSILRVVPDIHGRDVYTDDQLFTYAEQFQADFAASPARVIQASEGGMRLVGTTAMPLADAAARFLSARLPAGLLDAQAGAPDTAALRAAATALRRRMSELGELRAIADEMRGLLGRLAAALDAPTEFNRLVARVDVLRTRISAHDRLYGVVLSVSQLAELRRVQADRALAERDDLSREAAARRLRRDREFVQSFLEGCDCLADLLPEALRRVEEAAA